MSPVNHAGSVYEISPHRLHFVCVQMRCEILLKKTEISVTGLEIFLYMNTPASLVTRLKLERLRLVHPGN